jgi:phosphoglycerate dehydrogenase-like enzyme
VLMVVHHRFDLWQLPPWFAGGLREAFPDLQISHRNSYEGIEPELREAEVVFTISLRPEQFSVARSLRWIHAPTAAVHQLLFPELINSPVVVTNSREVHGPVVAEHVIALIFALAKKIPQSVLLQQKRVWGQEAIWNEGPRPQEIAGATVGLIGIGSIGSRVARMASSLGMRVVAVREHVAKGTPDGVEQVFPISGLHEMLKQSDYVVIAAPLTPATHGIINPATLAQMKASACLINVGRGPQVDVPGLVDALRNHRIAGAALDVFDREPLPADSPLWAVHNLLVTPHTAGLTEKLWQRHYQLFSENLRRYRVGEPLLYVVDKHRGY